MPKATKKKKEKHADFTKAKLKLGKGKKQASNATDTSFKARSIALPGQSNLNRALTDTAEPVTNAGLTLDEVLFRFRHPNAGVRKDALSGTKDILSAGVARETGKVVRALGGLVSDDDAGVRKALLGFMGWYIPSIPTTGLTPHLPLLLLQTSSALAHIYPEIRLDAARLISLLLSHVPRQVVGSWPHATSSKSTLDNGESILQGLRFAVGLGGEAGTAAALGKMGLGGRVTGLSTLLEFIRVALGDEAEGSGTGCWARRDQGTKGKGKAKEVVVSPEVVMRFGWVVNEGDWGLQTECWEIGRLGAGEADDQDAGNRALTDLYLQLSPLLLSTFLEAAPTAFSPSSAPLSTLETPISLCLITASLTLTLTRSLLAHSPSTEVRESVTDFTRRMAPYFPFNAPSAPSPTGLTPPQELNLVYANLVILLAPSLPPIQLATSRKEAGWRERVRAIEEIWREAGGKEEGREKGKRKVDARAQEEVADWVVNVLSPSKDVLAPGVTATLYTALLPIVQSLFLLPPTPYDIPTQIGQVFFSHLLKQPSTSAIRSLGDAFVISLIGAHEDRHSTIPFYIPPSSPVRQHVVQWAESVPRTLWELGIRDTDATLALVAWLRALGLRGPDSIHSPYSLLSAISFEEIAGKMGVWFHLVHPAKGSTLGPWAKFTTHQVRKAGLDMAVAWAGYDRNASLRNAVDVATGRIGGADLAYWKARSGNVGK